MIIGNMRSVFKFADQSFLVAAVAAICIANTFTTNAHAQTNATSGNNLNAGSGTPDASSESVFSESTEGFETAGSNQGRFQGNQLANQPTAGGNTNTTQQNAFNQARNLQRLNQQFNRASQNRNTGSTRGRRTIRPSLRLGFTPVPRKAQDLRESLDRQIQALKVKVPRLTDGRSEYALVKFDVGSRGEVILTGAVPNPDAGQLLSNILRMEPGVTSVRNELKIAPSAAAR